MKLADLGARGLVIYDGKRYRYTFEETWRAKPLAKEQETRLQHIRELRSVLAVINNDPFKIYVDFAHLQLEGVRKTGAGSGIRTRDDDPVVYIHDDNRFYQADQWTDLELGAEGDAGVVARRGGVLATIPGNDIPAGTFCVLVNLSGLE